MLPPPLPHFIACVQAPTTPNGTKLKRGAGGGLLRPMNSKKKKRKNEFFVGVGGKGKRGKKGKQPLLRFRLEEVARPSNVVLGDVAGKYFLETVDIAVNGCRIYYFVSFWNLSPW